MAESKAAPMDMIDLINVCRRSSAKMLDLLESAFAHLDPSAAACAIVHLVGRLQSRHSELDDIAEKLGLQRWAE